MVFFLLYFLPFDPPTHFRIPFAILTPTHFLSSPILTLIPFFSFLLFFLMSTFFVVISTLFVYLDLLLNNCCECVTKWSIHSPYLFSLGLFFLLSLLFFAQLSFLLFLLSFIPLLLIIFLYSLNYGFSFLFFIFFFFIY